MPPRLPDCCAPPASDNPQKLAAAKQQEDTLTQAVLAIAFRGGLVPTEAELARREGRNDALAAALLERISAERDPQVPDRPQTAARGI